MDTIPGERFVVNRWRDNPNERNIYWISYCETDSTLLYAIYTASALVDPFNRDIDPFASITTSYTGFACVEDNDLQGQELELNYTYYYSAPGHPFILSMEDFLLFYKPLYAIANIQVIGAFVCHRTVFRWYSPNTSPSYFFT
jgi:hypothetical protein